MTFKAGNAALILTSGNGLTLMPECRSADAGLTQMTAGKKPMPH